MPLCKGPHKPVLFPAVVVICAEDPDVRQFMLAAQEEGMTGDEYVYIHPYLLDERDGLPPWQGGDDRDNEARRAYGSLLDVRTDFIDVILFNIFWGINRIHLFWSY